MDIPRRPSRRLCVLVLLTLGIGLYALSLGSASAEFTAAQHRQLALYTLFWVGVLAAIAAVLPSRLRAPATAAFGALIIMSQFAWLTDIASAHPALQLAYATGAAALIWGVLRAAASGSSSQMVMAAGCAFLIGLAAVTVVPWSFGSAAEPALAAEDGAAPTDAPDIVFLSLDSLVPGPLAQTLIPGSQPVYMDALAHHGVRILPNGYSAFIPTRPALNSLLMLDDARFAELDGTARTEFFTGARSGRLAEALRPLGYRVETWFDSAYMGERAGPGVDRLRAGFGEQTLCNQITSPLALFGRCHPALRRVLDGSETGTPSEAMGAAIASTLAEREPDGPPLFLMAHVNSPGHTAANARVDKTERKYLHADADARETYSAYFNRKSRIAAAQIDRVLSAAAASPRTTLVFLYGDHGPYTTRRLPLDAETGLPRDPEQTLRYLTDRHGVLLGLWPGTACEPQMEPLATQTATLSSEAARAVLRCAGANIPDRSADPFIALATGQKIDPNDHPYERAGTP